MKNKKAECIKTLENGKPCGNTHLLSNGYCPVHWKPQHTPTPWVCYLSTVYKPERDDLDSSLDAIDQEKIVCSVINTPDAAFIVKAVNCHEELLTALKMAIDRPKVLPSKEFIEACKQAIAKAEGK